MSIQQSLLSEEKKRSSQSGRGMKFEAELEVMNEIYAKKGVALIAKIPVKTVLNRNSNGQTYANVVGKGLSDYIGVYHSIGIAIEAKETHQKAFPIRIYQKSHDTVHDHQLEFLDQFSHSGGGLSLWLIHFAQFNTVFILKHSIMREWVPVGKAVNRRIKFEEFGELPKDLCRKVERSWHGYDYLSEIQDWAI